LTTILTKSADVQGKHLLGTDNAKLGAVREIFIDLGRGDVAFVVIEAASLLGGSGKFHPAPWQAVRFDPVADVFRIEMAKDEFKASPSYDREQLANPSYGWEEQAARYFAKPAAGPDVAMARR
jgi:hypothetical protein